METLNDYLSSLPPASQNNSRQIVRGLIEKFERNPSERLAGYIEEMTQGELIADWSDKDHGEPPTDSNLEKADFNL